MSLDGSVTENLFSYGTLRQEEVQLATFGRRLEGRLDRLVEHKLTMTEVRDQNFVAANGAIQSNVQFSGSASDFIEGIVFALTREELEQADKYEPLDYGRVRVQLESGLDAWVYLQTS